jgi:hypothetical protein
MTYKETIEKIAKRALSDQELADFTRDQWGLIASYLREQRYSITDVTLGELLGSTDETITRNAMSILKVLQKAE